MALILLDSMLPGRVATICDGSRMYKQAVPSATQQSAVYWKSGGIGKGSLSNGIKAAGKECHRLNLMPLFAVLSLASLRESHNVLALYL